MIWGFKGVEDEESMCFRSGSLEKAKWQEDLMIGKVTLSIRCLSNDQTGWKEEHRQPSHWTFDT